MKINLVYFQIILTVQQMRNYQESIMEIKRQSIRNRNYGILWTVKFKTGTYSDAWQISIKIRTSDCYKCGEEVRETKTLCTTKRGIATEID